MSSVNMVSPRLGGRVSDNTMMQGENDGHPRHVDDVSTTKKGVSADGSGHNIPISRDACNRDATGMVGAACSLSTRGVVSAMDGNMAGAEEAAFRSLVVDNVNHLNSEVRSLRMSLISLHGELRIAADVRGFGSFGNSQEGT